MSETYADYIIDLSRTVKLLQEAPSAIKNWEFKPVIRFSGNADPAALIMDKPHSRVAIRIAKDIDAWAMLTPDASERYLSLPLKARNGFDPAEDDIEFLLSSHAEALNAIRATAQFLSKTLQAMLDDAASSRDLALAHSCRAKSVLRALVDLAEGKSPVLPEEKDEFLGL
jgi:hypothetical protein